MITRGIQFALYENWEGTRLVFIVKLWQIKLHFSKLLHKKTIPFIKPPELADPLILTPQPTGEVIEPEDMEKELEVAKPIEPEDM